MARKATILELGDPTAGVGVIAAALQAAWQVARVRPDVVIAPVHGGRAALIAFTPRVTVLAGRPDDRKPALQGWLERRQTRRSRLVYAADRETAVAFALRWRLDLARIRIAREGQVPAERVERDLAAGARARRSWHST